MAGMTMYSIQAHVTSIIATAIIVLRIHALLSKNVFATELG